MFDTFKQNRREVCRRNYHLAIKDGYFTAARKYLRDALVWSSPVARYQSREWAYKFRNGKIHAFVYKCSY
jgi:hypothetical protein